MITVLAVFALAGQEKGARAATTTYRNVRFAYGIEVPAALRLRSQISGGVGRLYASGDGEITLRVSAAPTLVGVGGRATRSLKAAAQRTFDIGSKPGASVSVLTKPNEIETSYWTNDRNVITRTIKLETGFATVEIRIPSSRGDAATKSFVRSMRSLRPLS
ncbi:hypothetical protein EON81_28165 [bacterium]|nr:MAG: hypothetical protein EON81_28165 [bacterium]